MTSCPPPPTSLNLQFDVKNLLPRETSLPHTTPSDTAVGSSRARGTEGDQLQSPLILKIVARLIEGRKVQRLRKTQRNFLSNWSPFSTTGAQNCPWNDFALLSPSFDLPFNIHIQCGPSRKHTQRLRDEEGRFIFVETTLRKRSQLRCFFFFFTEIRRACGNIQNKFQQLRGL